MRRVYSAVGAVSAGHATGLVCEVLGVSRSAFYAWKKGQAWQLKTAKSATAKRVRTVFEEHLNRYGSRRIVAELKAEGLGAGRFQVRKRMRELGLRAIQPRSFVPKTTQTDPNLRRSPNLLLEKPATAGIDEVWVGDITYLPMSGGGWTYLATWMDRHSRKIVGWHLSQSLDASIALQSLEKAIFRRSPPPGLIIHTDGGGQYMALAFRALLDRMGFRQSMTRPDNHYDNAFAESLFSRFKAELLQGGIFENQDDAQTASFEYIESYYNRIRRHSSIQYLAPDNFERQLLVKRKI